MYYYSLDHNQRRVEFSFIFYERSLMILRIESTSSLTLVFTRVDCSGCTNKSAHTCQHDVDVCMSMHVQIYPAQKTNLMLLNYRYKCKLEDARVKCSGCSEKTAYNCNCEYDINRKCYLLKNAHACRPPRQTKSSMDASSVTSKCSENNASSITSCDTKRQLNTLNLKMVSVFVGASQANSHVAEPLVGWCRKDVQGSGRLLKIVSVQLCNYRACACVEFHAAITRCDVYSCRYCPPA